MIGRMALAFVLAPAAAGVVTAQAPRTSAQPTPQQKEFTTMTPDELRAVSPALQHYSQQMLSSLWKRPGLSPRDRSLVTVAALIARQQTAEMAFHINLPLDNGVKPGEVSEVITHLAFYASWPTARVSPAAAPGIKLSQRWSVNTRNSGRRRRPLVVSFPDALLFVPSTC